MAIIVVAPDTLLPETFHDIELVLIELGLAILRCELSSHLTIDAIPTMFHHYATALEVFRAAVLLLILALSVCAYRNNSH